jgi:hypothetical protein
MVGGTVPIDKQRTSSAIGYSGTQLGKCHLRLVRQPKGSVCYSGRTEIAMSLVCVYSSEWRSLTALTCVFGSSQKNRRQKLKD